jgi:hypothetical protein
MGLGCGTCDIFTLSSENLIKTRNEYFLLVISSKFIKKENDLPKCHIKALNLP